MSAQQQDFPLHLRKQLNFLARSGAAFDADHREEAERIALTMRILFHNKGKNTISLLRHLGAETVLLRSDAPDRARQDAALAGRRIVGEFSWPLGVVSAANGGTSRPVLALTAPHRFLPAPDWWGETIAVLDHTAWTRSAVVLHVADKDGGAHIDADLPTAYEQLRSPGAVGHFEQADGTAREIDEAHYTFLRSMAFEVLHSPDLLALAKPEGAC